MAGKRQKKRRWPGTLMALLAACLLMTTGNSQSAAVHSPLTQGPRYLPDGAYPPRAAGPVTDAGSDTAEAPAPAEDAPGTEEAAPAPWYGPVPESAAVEDTYFSDAVFLGDSRTDGFRLYSGLDQGTYLCATGASVESVFTKAVDTPLGKLPLLDALAETACGKIYVMLGVNELGWPGTELFRAQAEELILRIRADHPEAVIMLQAILPVSARQDAKGSYVNNQRVRDYNGVLQDLAQELEVFYVAVDEPLTGEDGCLPADLNYDGVHLNPAGCAIWLDYLRTHAVLAAAEDGA